jgi:hypothetical protein
MTWFERGRTCCCFLGHVTTTGIFVRHWPYVNTCHVVGKAQLYKHWSFVSFPPTVSKGDSSQKNQQCLIIKSRIVDVFPRLVWHTQITDVCVCVCVDNHIPRTNKRVVGMRPQWPGKYLATAPDSLPHELVLQTAPRSFTRRPAPLFIHLLVCLTTGPKPLPKPALHTVRSRASSFRWEYPLLSLRSSSSYQRLLPLLPVTCIHTFIFPSITFYRRQFLREMWPI